MEAPEVDHSREEGEAVGSGMEGTEDKDGIGVDKDGTEMDKNGSGEDKDEPEMYKDGSGEDKDGTGEDKDGIEMDKNGSGEVKDVTERDKGGSGEDMDGTGENKDGTDKDKDGTEVDKDGTGEDKDGTRVDKEGPGYKGDTYAYTRRGEFTSENFKIELRCLPKYYNISHLKKLLNDTLKLEAHKVKPGGYRKNWAYVTFRDEDARGRALKVLRGYKWKKATFTVSTAKPVEDPLVKVMGERGGSNKQGKSGEREENVGLAIEERVTKSVTPYAHIPYDQQLELKQRATMNILRKFSNNLSQVNPDVCRLVQWQKKCREGQLCEVDPIIPSPVTQGYRNKCEFTVGMNPESGLVTVGFRVASYKTGSMCVAPVAHLIHIPQRMKDVVAEFESLVRESSLPPFSPRTHEGVWRQLTVRTATTSSLLIIVMIHPQEMSQAEQEGLKKTIVDHFTDGPGTHLGVTSIFFKSYAQKVRGEDKEGLEHLWGEHHLTETILGNTFRVSPDAFLQVNTVGAEVLYERVGQLAELDSSSVLLDICCGTGTIGVCLAKRCKRVYGVELVAEAAEDARHNAKTNGASNVDVWTGRAEETIGKLLERCRDLNTVAVVDPPRPGLNTSVVAGLRRCSKLKRLVYVSCDPTSATKNFINLGRPESKQYCGAFFFPVRAIPVDLFPHTSYFELVILFERWDKERWTRIMKGNPLAVDQKYLKPVTVLPSATNKDTLKEENGCSASNKRKLEAANSDEAINKKFKDN